MEQTTEEILQARGLRNGVPGPHGEWQDNAVTGQSLKVIARNALKKRAEDGIYPQLAAIHLEAVDMICLKLARILTGDANEPDHWQDIEGYAKLCRERLGATMAQHRARAEAAAAQTAGGEGTRTVPAAPAATSAPAAADTRPVPLSVGDPAPAKRAWGDILRDAEEPRRRTAHESMRYQTLIKLKERRDLYPSETAEFNALDKLQAPEANILGGDGDVPHTV